MAHARIAALAMAMAVAVALGAGCSGGSSSTGGTTTASTDPCTAAIDKLFANLEARGLSPDRDKRDGAIADCRTRPDDPLFACINAAADDAAIDHCMRPTPKGEPSDQLERAVESLRTYFFVHETFTEQHIPLTPATPCCELPGGTCPPDPAAPAVLTEILNLDLTRERRFQYRYESTGTKAVIEAVGDLDCDGTAVTYRREVEQRSDGNMHITVVDPPAGAD